MTAPLDLHALVAAVEADPAEAARLARVLFAALVGAVEPLPFSTHHKGPRPDHIGLRRWQKLAPQVPGAMRRGRFWMVSREAWEAYERGTSPSTPAANDPAWSPASALRLAGVRGAR
ncbi:MAG TPA: hypothetical protein VGY54_22875 [Polyangiaceae bacterium]|nr:hypothetical protein [Polyangiaceae bacterium]